MSSVERYEAGPRDSVVVAVANLVLGLATRGYRDRLDRIIDVGLTEELKRENRAMEEGSEGE